MDTKDFTPGGHKIEGQYENDRNAASAPLLKAILREACGATDVIIAHHLVYVLMEHNNGQFLEVTEEIPSMDALIFDHDIAEKIWGHDFRPILAELAALPVPERDERLAQLYAARSQP